MFQIVTDVFDAPIGIFGMLTDIRERIEAVRREQSLQAELFQAAKLGAIGTVVASIAHELNNPLAMVLGYASRIASSQDIPAPHADRAQKIKIAAERMKKVVSHLTSFVRTDGLGTAKELFSVKTPIDGAIIIFGSQLEHRNVALEVQYEREDLGINGDATQVESIFQNLISNSRDALEDIADRAKRITIKVRQAADDPTKVEFVYTDNASGMSAVTLKRMFEPYFTTKPAGKGTGLGMSIVHRILKEHDGTIVAASEVGVGTTFTIRFPLAQPAVASQAS
jgi:signal transduction histidine kinase